MYADWVDAHLTDPNEALYRLVLLAARDLRRAFQDALRAHSLTATQFGVLLGASGHGSIGEIADQLFTDPTSIGRLVERMERGGMVERFRQEEDRRVVRVRLTETGEGLLRQTLPLYVEQSREMLGFLADTRKADLVRTLERIRRHLQESPANDRNSQDRPEEEGPQRHQAG
jgi:DNA-binding MarR family transcriptional regulator